MAIVSQNCVIFMLKCVYLVSVHPLRSAHPENGSLAAFVIYWRPKFREEVRCAMTLSENSECPKPRFSTCIIPVSKIVTAMRAQCWTAPLLPKLTQPKYFNCTGLMQRLCFLATLTHASTQANHVVSHCLARDGWWLWMIAVCFLALQVSHSDSLGQGPL